MSVALSAPLLGGRVLELTRECHGRSWRLAVMQQDGKDRGQVGGFDLTDAEIPLFLASVRAFAVYAACRPRGARLYGCDDGIAE